MEYIRFLVMTKSSKNKGFCVAGFNIDTKRWVRLVTNDAEKKGALSKKHLIFSDGSECQVGEVIGVWVKAHIPSFCQTENYLISDVDCIQLLWLCPVEYIQSIYSLERPSHIFLNARPYLTLAEVEKLNRSLYFVEVFDLQISLKEVGDGKSKSKVSFTYNNDRYLDIAMTDPEFYLSNLMAKRAWIVVSLPNEPYGDAQLFYKFVARIIPIFEENDDDIIREITSLLQNHKNELDLKKIKFEIENEIQKGEEDQWIDEYMEWEEEREEAEQDRGYYNEDEDDMSFVYTDETSLNYINAEPSDYWKEDDDYQGESYEYYSGEYEDDDNAIGGYVEEFDGEKWSERSI